MRILDIDLDFFLDGVQYRPADARLSDKDYRPWNYHDVRRFLEVQCGLSAKDKVKGRYIKTHEQAFFFLRELIAARQLQVPFEIIHVDAHADLGLGDTGYVYLMTEVLHWNLERRALDVETSLDRTKYPEKMTEGNFLAFAIACRWVKRLVYVAHPKARDDLGTVHFKNFDPGTNFLQLKQCTSEQLKQFNYCRQIPQCEFLEPEVPFIKIPGPQYSNGEPFSFAVFCHSPRYTPSSSDALVPIIMEYIDPI